MVGTARGSQRTRAQDASSLEKAQEPFPASQLLVGPARDVVWEAAPRCSTPTSQMEGKGAFLQQSFSLKEEILLQGVFFVEEELDEHLYVVVSIRPVFGLKLLVQVP